MVIDHDSGRYPPQALINALDEVSPDRVVILGGPVAVSQRVEDQLNEEYPRWAEWGTAPGEPRLIRKHAQQAAGSGRQVPARRSSLSHVWEG